MFREPTFLFGSSRIATMMSATESTNSDHRDSMLLEIRNTNSVSNSSTSRVVNSKDQIDLGPKRLNNLAESSSSLFFTNTLTKVSIKFAGCFEADNAFRIPYCECFISLKNAPLTDLIKPTTVLSGSTMTRWELKSTSARPSDRLRRQASHGQTKLLRTRRLTNWYVEKAQSPMLCTPPNLKKFVGCNSSGEAEKRMVREKVTISAVIPRADNFSLNLIARCFSMLTLLSHGAQFRIVRLAPER